PYEHSYPFCWRCDTPLIYYARSSWFISMTKVRDELVKNTKSVNWMPESIRDGRMGNFVENVIDWGISRERYWGTPLPIWVCDKCGHIHVIGSRKELSELTGAPEDTELHKPFIDPLTFECEKCGGTMKRVPEVMDCWYDSGSMPFAQWHYPFEHEEEFKGHFPAQFISEAVDQTRGWFYTLLAISTLLFNKAPFENCIVLGHVQDKDGQKMSKHKGNVVDPWSVLDKQGADAVRWYFYSSSAPWLPSRFYDDAVSESQRKFMGTLWNTYAFYILYAEIDKFDPTGYELKPENIMDRWILSKANSLVKSVTEHLDNYRIFEPARELIDFVDELSNWYVRLDRERFWGSENTKDKMDAFMTLYTVLETLTRLIAPFVPFMSESIYQNIVRSVDASAPISVHLCDYPVADASLIDSELEVNMDAVKDVVALGRACRNVANIKTRQPISEVFVSGISHLGGIYTDLIKSELNVKEVSLGAAAEEFISYRIKPQLRTLGPKYGKMLGAIREHLASTDGIKIVNAVKNGGTYSFDADGNKIDLTEEDLLVEPVQKEGFMVETSDKYAVVIDTVLTDSLIEEGFVREIISKMQTMRKEAGFEVTDHITVAFSGNDKIADVVSANKAQIMSELLCEEISDRTDDGFSKELNINGEKVAASVKKVG
ncbi:MAG: isoleucine--tRNA ligase, partial [Christensenellaceae bacterium]|nr:isoleucine--tRNA ligase [Christensenellaceae bacterium]